MRSEMSVEMNPEARSGVDTQVETRRNRRRKNAIWGFRNHPELSNFHPLEITYEGITYPTVEHAFQATKTTDPALREHIAELKTPREAKQAGRRLDLRDNWDRIRVDVMTALVRIKFRTHPEAAQTLLSTGKAPIYEANTWGDQFWGVDAKTGDGYNHLGRILEELREELREELNKELSDELVQGSG